MCEPHSNQELPQSPSTTERFSQWSAALEWRAIPDDQRALVPLRVLDTIGLIFAGSKTQASQAALIVARGNGGAGRSTALVGGDGSPPAWAAFVHGIAAHCRDFDDTFQDSVVHPGSVVVPVALAAGEARDASPEDIGAAIIAGYEAAARIGAVAGRRFHHRGLHATGVVGPLAAAVAAARIMKLDPAQTASAIGLAASMSSGLLAFLADGAWSKWLHVGWAAHGGIVAAELAARDFRGPSAALDGRYNLYAALLHGEMIDLAPLARVLGARYDGGLAHFKYYPCAHVIQPYIDAVIAIVEREQLAAGDIRAIRCDVAPWAAAIVCEPRAAKLHPATEVEAIASLPYQLAVAAVERRVGLDALEDVTRSRADLARFMTRIGHRADPALGHGFDGRVEIETADGRVFRREAASLPPDRKRVRAKFLDNAGRVAGAEAAQRMAISILAAPAPAANLLALCAALIARAMPEAQPES